MFELGLGNRTDGRVAQTDVFEAVCWVVMMMMMILTPFLMLRAQKFL